MSDSEDYQSRKSFFDSMLTVYGRKPVLEALQESDIQPFRLHLADSNKKASILKDITELAVRKGAEIQQHSREALSRISRNRRQDQGVVLDINAPQYQPIEQLNPAEQKELVAVENVTNPQNLGMIIRSVAASPANGLIIPKKGCAALDALVIKASAGTLFRTPIFYCRDLQDAAQQLKQQGYKLVGLAGEGPTAIQDLEIPGPKISILGNETEGLSPKMKQMCDELVHIPMNHGVESLNVAVAAALVAFGMKR